MKACFPSRIERQIVKLVLKIINELNISAPIMRNELHTAEFRNNIPEFVDILHTVWKLINVNTFY